MTLSDLQTAIETLQENTALWDELSFERRIEAVDDLEFYIIDRIDGLLGQHNDSLAALLLLKQQAQTLKYQLEAIDSALFERLRVAIRNGGYRGIALLNLLNAYVDNDSSDQLVNTVVGYDNLDLFTNGLFPLQPLPLATLDREPEMVFYQKTPTRIILDLVAKATLTNQDVFYDLGSGLGHVCVFVNLLSGVTARGIEVEPAYCTYATLCANDLNLPNVTFISDDARTANYADGTVFFLYTPFEGQLLQDVLDRLRSESRDRSIRLFTYGPCTTAVAQQQWLICTGQVNDYLHQLVEFRSVAIG